MLQQSLATRLHGRLHYAHVVAALTFLTLLVVAGIRATPSVLIVPLEKNFGWNRDQITLAVSIGIALFGLMGPFAAAMQRFGIRRTMVIAPILLACAMAGSAFVTTPFGLIVTWGILAGVGTGAMAMVLGVTIVNRWFETNRGSVLGLLTASTATGQLLFLPVLAWVTEHYDWRVVVYIVAIAALVLMLLVLLLLSPERLTDVGLYRYGGSADDASTPRAGNPIVAAFRALHRLAFRHVLAAVRYVLHLRTQHQRPHRHAHDRVLRRQRHTGNESGRTARTDGRARHCRHDRIGLAVDRYDSRKLLFFYYGLRGLSLLYLPWSDFSFGSLGLFTMFYGLDWIATVPPTVKLTTNRFGSEMAPLVYGWIGAGHQLGAATAAFGAGVLRVQTNRYLEAFLIAGSACLVAAVMALPIRRNLLAFARPAAA